MLTVIDSFSNIVFSAYLFKEGLEAFGESGVGRKVIHNVKYTGDFVLLAKDQKFIRGMNDRPTCICRCY
jgi:hypothetical protein